MKGLFRKILIGILICLLIIVCVEALTKLPGLLKTIEKSDEKSVSKTDTARTQANSEGSETSYSENINYKLSLKINNFVNMLSSKKYQEAYNVLDPDYKMLYYPTLQSFIKLNSKLYRNPKSARIKYIDKINENQYVCRVIVNDDNFDDMYAERYKNYQDTIQKSYTVNILDKDKYTIADDGFISTKNINSYTKVGKIGLCTAKVVRYYNKVYITLEVFNGESVPITILDSNSINPKLNIKLSTINSYNSAQDNTLYFEGNYVLAQLKESIQPGKFARLTLPFYARYDEKISKLILSNIMVGTEIRTAEIE